jgi:hypothetical protein
MAYLGNSPARSFISFERQVFTIVNSQTVYTLDHSVTNENDIRLVVNNIVQEPGSGKAYTATGTTLTLSAALVNGTDEMYCVFLGRATATNAPGAGSVGTSQIADSSVSLAKLTATGTKDATTFLRGDNTFAAAGLNGWSEDGANNNLLPASSSAGIYLGVTSATAANLLDDYEEGTWTPSFANAPSATFGTNGQQGYYTKVGRSVTVGFNMSITGLGGGSGGADVITLPFAASNTPTASRYMGTIGGDDNWSTNLSGNNTVLQIYGDYLNTRIFLQKNNCSNKADISLADIGTSRVLGTITYFTDA